MDDKEYLKKYYEGDIKEAIKRLNNGEPVQYIVGNVDFMGYKINVKKGVLIPRFETELLVFNTIEKIKENFNEKIDVLEIGTGSGCIAITLKKELDLNVDAVDISKSALSIASKNALLNNVEVNFFESDVFSKIEKKYDVIISNPPYIAYDDEIMDIILEEPHEALFAEDEGLYFYKKIIGESKNYLKEKFIIAFEIGSMQGKAVLEIAKAHFLNATVELLQDMQGKDRYVFIIKN